MMTPEKVVAQLSVSELTRSNYLSRLRLFCGHIAEVYGECDLEHLTQSQITQYIQQLQMAGYSASSIIGHAAALRSMFKVTGQVELEKALYSVPKIAKKLRPEGLDIKQQKKLIHAVELTGNKRNVAVIKTLLYTGLRVQELCDLDVQDVQLHERSGVVVVRNGKRGKERRVPLPIEARYAIQDYLESDKHESSGQLFVTNRGTRLQTRSVLRLCNEFGTHPHALRHSYVRNLVAAGIDLVTVATLAGHEDIRTTAQYATPSESEMAEAVSKAFSGHFKKGVD